MQMEEEEQAREEEEHERKAAEAGRLEVQAELQSWRRCCRRC